MLKYLRPSKAGFVSRNAGTTSNVKRLGCDSVGVKPIKKNIPERDRPVVRCGDDIAACNLVIDEKKDADKQ